MLALLGVLLLNAVGSDLIGYLQGVGIIGFKVNYVST